MCCLQDADGKSAVDRLFGLKLHTQLKCEETGEEFEVGTDGHGHAMRAGQVLVMSGFKSRAAAAAAVLFNRRLA